VNRFTLFLIRLSAALLVLVLVLVLVLWCTLFGPGFSSALGPGVCGLFVAWLVAPCPEDLSAFRALMTCDD